MTAGENGHLSAARRRIAHLIAPARSGGAESVVLALAGARNDMLGPTGVIVLGAHTEDHPFVAAARAAGIEVSLVTAGGRHYPAQISQTTSLVRELGYELVHTHVYHADFVGWIAARRLGIPVVATVHGFTGGGVKNRIYQAFDRRLLRYFDRVQAVSRGVRERLLASGVPHDRLDLIPNGIGEVETLDRDRARRELGVDEDVRLVGWVGRLSREKGADLFLDALARISDPRIQATIIGEGPERESLERDAASIPEVGIRFTGRLDRASRLYSAFDVLVISSRTEGLPVVLLEALSARIPIVTFAVGGIPQAVSDREAWLVEPGDVPGLATAITAALHDPGERQGRTAAGKVRVEREHGLSRWLERVESSYDAAGSRRGVALAQR